MRSQGWEDGQGLGRQSRGIARPLEADGQLPRNKAGLGYVRKAQRSGSTSVFLCDV